MAILKNFIKSKGVILSYTANENYESVNVVIKLDNIDKVIESKLKQGFTPIVGEKVIVWHDQHYNAYFAQTKAVRSKVWKSVLYFAVFYFLYNVIKVLIFKK